MITLNNNFVKLRDIEIFSVVLIFYKNFVFTNKMLKWKQLMS